MADEVFGLGPTGLGLFSRVSCGPDVGSRGVVSDSKSEYAAGSGEGATGGIGEGDGVGPEGVSWAACASTST